MLIEKSLLDELKNDILKANIPGLPKLPGVGKTPGLAPDMQKKNVGDTITRGGKDYRITAIDPSKKGWGRFKLQSVEGQPEEGGAKREAKPVDTAVEGKKLEGTVKQLMDRVKEKLGGAAPQKEVAPGEIKPKEAVKPDAEKDIGMYKNAMSYLDNLAERLQGTEVVEEAKELKREILEKYIFALKDRMKEKMGSRFIETRPKEAAPSMTYEALNTKVSDYDNKMQSQPLTVEENKEYSKRL